MSEATFFVGDVFDVMADMPDDSVDLVMTSPPFIGLRSYLPDDHPGKAKEIGREPDPVAFIDTLLRLTAEWDRLLAPHGSICVELGDTYSKGADGWPNAKSAALVPELYRVGLAYGMNPLNGEPSPAGRWRVRNTVRWVRPNPTVGALGDKYRPATSDMVIACKAKDRWFDLDAVRKGPTEPKPSSRGKSEQDRNGNGRKDGSSGLDSHPGGAPPLDYWEITSGGYSADHFAVYPPKLCEIPIESMCPREVCLGCGEPRRRIVDVGEGDGGDRAGTQGERDTSGQGHHGHRTRKAETIGWSECDCTNPTYRPGLVLDPFGGSGTTGMVATGMGRDCWLIDIDERNVELARDRIGMFMRDAA